MRNNLKIVDAGDVVTWMDRATSRTLFQCDITELPANMQHRALVYGVKQAVSDAAASGGNITEKVAMMRARWDDMRSGEWGTRKVGTGQHSALFAALVTIGLTTDTPEQRAKFAKLPPAAIGKLYARPDVAKLLENNADDETLADFIVDTATA